MDDIQKTGSPRLGSIRDDWDVVGPILRELCQNYEQAWIPEDIYAECVSGKSLYFCTAEGFVVCKTYVEEYSGKEVFFIWVACAYDQGKELVGVHLDFFVKAARSLNCARIETASPIPALEAYLTGKGFSVPTRVYEVNLDEFESKEE